MSVNLVAADCSRLATRMRELRESSKEIQKKIISISEAEGNIIEQQKIAGREMTLVIKSVIEKKDAAGFMDMSEVDRFNAMMDGAFRELDGRVKKLRRTYEKERVELVEIYRRQISELLTIKSVIREGLAKEAEEIGDISSDTIKIKNACIICGENPVDRVFIECGHTSCGRCCEESVKSAGRSQHTGIIECFICRKIGRTITLFLP